MSREEEALNSMIQELTMERLKMQIDLYRAVIERVKLAIPLLAGNEEQREGALQIISKLCDICDDFEKEAQ